MYNISESLRKKMYNGELYYTPNLYIGDTHIEPKNIKKISLDNPLYDKTSEKMNIGTFISKKLDVELRTQQEIDLTEKVNLSVDAYDDNYTYFEENGWYEIEGETSQGIATGKNLLTPNNYETSGTKSGVTYTNNGDCSVTVNGTNTSSSYLIYLLTKNNWSYNSDLFQLKQGTYKFSCLNASPNCCLLFNVYYSDGTNDFVRIENNSSKTMIFNETVKFNIRLYTPENATVPNVTLYPKIEYYPQILPDGYTQVDYIESSGTQYIDTGFKPNSNTRMVTKVYINDAVARYDNIGGAREGNEKQFHIIINNEASSFDARYGNKALYFSKTITGLHTIDYNKNNITIDGETQTFTASTFQTDYNAYIFGVNNNGSLTQPANYKLYEMKWYNDTLLIRDYIPCYRNSDNVVGLYDLANNTFYTNQGTGAFTYGSVINKPTPDYPQDIITKKGTITEEINGDNYTFHLPEGKNLFNDYRDAPVTISGITVSPVEDGVKLDGTYNKDTQRDYWLTYSNNSRYNNLILLKSNSTYTVTISLVSGVIKSQGSIWANLSSRTADDNKTFTWNYKAINRIDNTWSATFTTGTDDIYASGIRFTLPNTTTATFDNAIFHIQLEEGTTATDYEPYGVTPIELCKIGTYQDKIKKSTGKNLFDKNNANTLTAYINGSGEIVQDTELGTLYIPCKPNTKYALQKSLQEPTSYNRFKVGCCASTPAINTQLSKYNNLPNGTTETTMIFETDSTASYLVFNFAGGSASSIAEVLENIQIEEGTTATDYEPYGKVWYVRKEIGKVVLDGSESWHQSSLTTENYLKVYCTILNIGLSYLNPVISDKFINNSYQTVEGNVIAILGNNNINIGISTSITNDITTFKSWLSDNNTIVYYALATPTITEITDEILLNDLNAVGEMVTIPIGEFNIETSPNDYYKTYKITALDNAVLMKNNIDITPFMSVATGDTQPSITAENLLSSLCNYYNVSLGTYPNINRNVKTYFYDNTYSGKRYISYIAELMGGNAVIDRNGTLNIVPVKGNPVTTIDGLSSKSFQLNEKYKISKVVFDNGVVIPSEFGTDTDNTLFIRTDNLFINGTDNERDAIVQNIYNSVNGYEIQALETENFVDLSLDASDIVIYQLDNDYYKTHYTINWNWEGSIMGKVNTTFPSKQQEMTTNHIDVVDPNIRKIQTEINQQEGRITTIAQDVSDLEEIVEVFKVDLETNVVIVGADNNNVPTATKNYDVGFSASYLGASVTVTPTTTSSYTGITTNINSSRIRFSVSNSTAITNLDNKYTFTFTYTDSNNETYTITRVITVSLITQDNQIVYSETEPTDHNILWYDTINNQLKRYTTDGWIIINDYSTEITNISTNLSNINTNLQNQIDTANANITRTRSDLELAVSQTATALQLNFSDRINTTNSNLATTTNTVDEIKSYINFENGNIILGKTGNQYKLRVTNDGILIYYNDRVISNWRTDQFTITQINMGNFSFIPRDNGSLSFRKER